VKALKSVSHRNIVALLGHEQLSPSEYSISITFCPGGSPSDHLHKHEVRQFTLKRKKKVFGDILNAIEALHSLKDPLIHGDIKSLNVLLMAHVHRGDIVPWAKLCDFGSSDSQSEAPQNGNITVGTVQWITPEVILREPSSPASDIYSVGMVFSEICYRRVPFSGTRECEVMTSILHGTRPDHDPGKLLKDHLTCFMSILDSCWLEKPEGRPSIRQLRDRMNEVFIESTLSSPLSSLH